MKKSIITLALTASCMLSYAQETISLPAPATKAAYGMSVMEALRERRSERAYIDSQLSKEQLSTVLWAACGVSDELTGKITAPSAMNKQDITLYVTCKDGTWRYDNKGNKLIFVSKKDLRKEAAANQEFAAKAPVSIIIVSNLNVYGKKGLEFGAMSAGYVSENIYLACTAMGLSTVARATMNEEVLRQELQLKDGEKLMLNHPVSIKPAE